MAKSIMIGIASPNCATTNQNPTDIQKFRTKMSKELSGLLEFKFERNFRGRMFGQVRKTTGTFLDNFKSIFVARNVHEEQDNNDDDDNNNNNNNNDDDDDFNNNDDDDDGD